MHAGGSICGRRIVRARRHFRLSGISQAMCLAMDRERWSELTVVRTLPMRADHQSVA